MTERKAPYGSDKPYTGALAKPIKVDPRAPRPESLAKMGEWFAKVDALCDHYGIPEEQRNGGHWSALVLHLACDHVPGFQFDFDPEKRGRPSRSPAMLVMLVVDVLRLKAERQCSVSEAARILTTSSRFSDRWGRWEPRTLANAFREAKKDKRVWELVAYLNRDNTKKD